MESVHWGFYWEVVVICSTVVCDSPLPLCIHRKLYESKVEKVEKMCLIFYQKNALPTLSPHVHTGSCKKSHDCSYYLPNIV